MKAPLFFGLELASPNSLSENVLAQTVVIPES